MATGTLTTPGLMTFAQFEQMPDDGDRRYELRNGEPVELPFPIHKHFVIQQRLRRLLEFTTGNAGEVATEWGFRIGEYEYRRADVAYLSQERFDALEDDGYLEGAPELVIEVLSPSNRHGPISETKRLCLENGCQEFWVVDPVRQTVTVSTLAGEPRRYQAGQQVPLVFGGHIEVDAIFAL